MIKILTDGCSNLSTEYMKENGVGFINLSVAVDGKEINIDSKDFDIKEYYAKMREGLPVKTSLINTQKFADFFEENLKNNEGLIFVGMSSGISGSTACAKTAADMLSEEYRDKKIAVVDTLAASLGEGLLVMYAVKMLSQGYSFEKIIAELEEKKNNLCQLFMVSDIMHLKKGGRLSATKAAVATVLNIKPILTGNEEGKIEPYSKSRGVSKTLDKLSDFYDELCLDKTADIAIAHADNDGYAEYLLGRLEEKGFKGNCVKQIYEPVTGSHVGPDTVALFFFGKRKK